MVILDTDIVSHLQRYGTTIAMAIEARIATCGQAVAVTMVTVAEQVKRRLAECAAAKTPEEYADRLAWLRRTIEFYRDRTTLDFDDRAAEQFKKLKAAKIRVGTMDLRIASIALANSATLVTANLSDFRLVPGLKVEDWTDA